MIDLYTAPTPNGWKVAMALEELELDCKIHYVDLAKGEQHTQVPPVKPKWPDPRYR